MQPNSSKRKPSTIGSPTSPSSNRASSFKKPLSPSAISSNTNNSLLLGIASPIKKKEGPRAKPKKANIDFEIPEIVIEAPKESDDNVSLIQIDVDTGSITFNQKDAIKPETTNRRPSIIGSLVMAAATSTRSIIASLSSKKMPSTPILIQLDPPSTVKKEEVKEVETNEIVTNKALQIEIPSASTTLEQIGIETSERAKEIAHQKHTSPTNGSTNIPSFKLSINLPTLVIPPKQSSTFVNNQVTIPQLPLSSISNEQNKKVANQVQSQSIDISIPTQQPDVTTQSLAKKSKDSPRVEKMKSLPNLNPSRLNQSPKASPREIPKLESHDSTPTILHNLNETFVEMNRAERDVIANNSTLTPQPIPTLKPNHFLTVNPLPSQHLQIQPHTSKLKAMSRSILFDMERESDSKIKKPKQLHTPWGTIELSCWKLFSIIGLSATIILLVSLLTCVILSFIYRTSETEARLNAQASDLKAVLSDMHILTHQLVYGGFSTTKYQSYMVLRTNAWNFLWNLTDSVQYEYENKFYLFSQYSLSDYKSTIETPTKEILWTFTEIVNKMYYDQVDSAIDQIQDFEDTGGTKNVSEAISTLREYSLSLFSNHDKISYVTTSANLILGVLSLIIVIPALILSFTLSLNKDAIHRKRWKKANAIVLLDTMADDQLRDLFRTHCEKEMALENYLFLQEVSIYKDLCIKAIEAQDAMYGADLELGSASSSIASTTASSITRSKKQKQMKQVTEKAGTFLQGAKVLKRFGWLSDKDIDTVEQKKYEKALEIYKKFLDMHGYHTINTNKANVQEIKELVDGYLTGDVDFLPNTLFDTLEREIAELLVDTHRRFKKTLAFQKQMKIEKYIQMKRRSRRNTTVSEQ